MSDNCHTEILVEKECTIVSYCQGCQSIYLHYNNLFVKFNRTGFKHFAECFYETDFESCCFAFQDGAEKVLITSCHSDVRFTFNEAELEEMQQTLCETEIMLEIKDILGY